MFTPSSNLWGTNKGLDKDKPRSTKNNTTSYGEKHFRGKEEGQDKEPGDQREDRNGRC